MRKRNNLVKKEFRENYKKYIEDLKKRSKEFSEPVSEKFSDLPLSKETLRGLRDNGYVTMTEIQRKAIFLALKGRDILGAAKTGSGKTLCFLIPILEDLLKHYWSPIFGLGALVITPTRELAYQIFEVLRKIGKQHHFSAGLVIGGKDLSAEQQLISRMCILICTPGRLLQHMDETELFELKELRILVLDEADRILDLGFEKTVNAIIATLPKRRQTLLFSATQTKSVKDLARLSLQDAEYVAVYEQPQVLTPSKLTQNYIFCELSSKLKILYSFLRSHTRMKLLVFVSSCKQVRFIYEAFRRLRCGLPLLELHGKQKQPKRMSIYDEFCRRRFACLIATDIAARGLDFPSIHWVLQVDCPEDANTYIHRVGRTARYESGGNALLFLLPSEKAFLKLLQEKKVPISELQLNPRKIKSITANLAALCAEHPDIKYLAQKYFVSYIRSVFLQANKKVFDVSSLSLDEFSVSLGLSQPPKVRCVKQVKDGKNKCRQASQPDTTTPTAEKVGLNEVPSFFWMPN
ncbi:hypothetical protein Zmor_004134 [Zophobas morio]|uniref:ATP-dependent RNA helicase n=1 Tax=Zophobas morio TaxID=2755281 RepID=A0AA38HJG9_9CUCU|nr:hypothetical protein Zmor_004134 [Zophobas morio]